MAFWLIMYALGCRLLHMATECNGGCVFSSGNSVNTPCQVAAFSLSLPLSLSASLESFPAFYTTAVKWKMKTEGSGRRLWDVGMRCRSEIKNAFGLKRRTTKFVLVGVGWFYVFG